MITQRQYQLKADSLPSFAPIRTRLPERVCACGQHSSGDERESCRKKSVGMLQRAAINASPVHEVPPIVHEVLRSPGQPLDAATRAFFEPRFGHDFSRVRVHTDAKAAESARAVNALAYTVGRDVVFGTGQYMPKTVAGHSLLAHELTHVVQQRRFGMLPLVQRKLKQAPTRFITSEPDEISAATDDEATLDKHIANRQQQAGPGGKGKYIGSVTFKSLPELGKGKEQNAEASLVRRAVKHALLEVIVTDIHEKAGIELRVRVPLSDEIIVSEFVMVVLRFDSQRNVEVEYAGKDVQKRAALAFPEVSLPPLEKQYGVKFVTGSITVKMPGAKTATKFTGKKWSANDIHLLKQTLPLLGSQEKALLKGCKIRRLNAAMADGAAGFYSSGDNSINLADAALPFEKTLWFGEGGKFYSRGVHTLLHEIGHALHLAKAPVGSPKGAKLGLDRFKKAVKAESKKRTGKAPGKKFPPPRIIPPTDYARKDWDEFYADTYSIYRTNPSFLKTPEFKYLFDFFNQQFP